eukprot:COSAG02_NODE_7828_length_2831_cov_1.731698_1_plen_155_part_10
MYTLPENRLDTPQLSPFKPQAGRQTSNRARKSTQRGPPQVLLPTTKSNSCSVLLPAKLPTNPLASLHRLRDVIFNRVVHKLRVEASVVRCKGVRHAAVFLRHRPETFVHQRVPPRGPGTPVRRAVHVVVQVPDLAWERSELPLRQPTRGGRLDLA